MRQVSTVSCPYGNSASSIDSASLGDLGLLVRTDYLENLEDMVDNHRSFMLTDNLDDFPDNCVFLSFISNIDRYK